MCNSHPRASFASTTIVAANIAQWMWQLRIFMARVGMWGDASKVADSLRDTEH